MARSAYSPVSVTKKLDQIKLLRKEIKPGTYRFKIRVPVSSVTVTPTLKSINGSVAGVSLTGDAAHVFNAKVKDGKVIITAKDEATLITRYDYKVRLLLTIANTDGGTIVYETSEVRLRLTQSRPKVAITPAGAVFFSGINRTVVLDAAATLAKAENPEITGIELINNKAAFTCEYNKAGDKKLTIRNIKGIKGRAYTLQFKVTFKGHADSQ